jgi:hypothetical protein
MLWTKDSDLEMFVTMTDFHGELIDVDLNWLSIEIKVGKSLFKADSNPMAIVNGEAEQGVFKNCYITTVHDEKGIMVVVPADTLDFGTVYMRSCVHVPDAHFEDGYKDVWTIWMPCNLAITTEKGFNN